MSNVPPAQESSAARSARLLALIALGLIALALAVYGQVVTFRFLGYDDPFYVTNNQDVKAGLTAESVAWAWTSMRAFWHPLTWMSHLVDWQLYGDRPAGHHVTNLIVHLAGGIVALIAWQRMTGSVWQAALVAALFVLHPLRAESVAWIAERKGLLAALFWMLGLWAYAEYTRRPAWWRYLLVAVALLLGLLSKPSLVTFPFVLLLLDVWPLARWRPRWLSTAARSDVPRAMLAQIVVEKLPLVALVAAASAVAISAEGQFGALEWLPELTLQSRIANALIAVWLYLGKLVFPWDLAFFYRHPGNDVSLPAAWCAAVGLLLVTGACLWMSRRQPYWLVGWLWFLGTLVPVSGLVQVGGHRMADRYADIPLVGLAVALAAGLADLIARRPAWRDVVAGSTAVALVVLALTSARQASFWRDDERLLTHALAVDPDNWVALTNRARGYLSQQRYAEAEADCRRAWKVHPHNSAIASNLAEALEKQGETDEALRWYHTAIELDPSVAPHHMVLAMALARAGQDSAAEAEFRRATELAPGDRLILRNYGAFLGERGRFDEAAGVFRRLLAAYPDSLDDQLNLARTLVAAGDLPGAEASLNAALIRAPRLVEAYQARADVLARQGRAAEAMADFQRGAPLPPGMLLRIVWILAADPRAEVRNASQALALAEQLAASTGHRDPAALDALAMAQAASGRFDEAARTARDGTEVARGAGRTRAAELLASRAALYRTQRPLLAPYAELAVFWDAEGQAR